MDSDHNLKIKRKTMLTKLNNGLTLRRRGGKGKGRAAAPMSVLGGIFHVDSMVAGGNATAAPRGAKLVSEEPIILASSYVARGYLTYRVIDGRRVSPVSAPFSWFDDLTLTEPRGINCMRRGLGKSDSRK